MLLSTTRANGERNLITQSCIDNKIDDAWYPVDAAAATATVLAAAPPPAATLKTEGDAATSDGT